MSYDYKTLEFEEYKQAVKSSFSSSFAIKFFEDMLPYDNVSDITHAQKETAEAIELAEQGKLIEQDDTYYDVYSKFDQKHATIEISDYITIKNFLVFISELKVKLSGNKVKTLSSKVNSLNDISGLRNDIERSIDDSCVIKDDATPELATIRRELNLFKNRVKRTLNDILGSSNGDKFIQDRVIVLRNGRYTIPCKTNFSQYIQGIIHDKSASGQTLYIEPSSIVGLNNAMQELIIRESEEIAKILHNLRTVLNVELNNLKHTTSVYTYIAFRLEVGAFYRGTAHTFGEICDNILLASVHHPLLYIRKGAESVPIDFVLDSNTLSAIITGANTGGKTAALKSIGLNHLITYCGLPVFAKVAKCVFFKSILADIGDQQSLMMDLSTFSSHMLNIKRIVECANHETLILLDELGTGTEPREGASIAVAVLKYIEQKQARTVVTTHFSEVKNYALNNEHSIFYAVDFDYETFAPRYTLLKNILGKSDPIMIAERLGFLPEIIDSANNELSKYKSSVEMQVEELNRLVAENEHNKRLLDEEKVKLEERLNSIKTNEDALKKRLNSKELELLEEAYSLLQKYKRLTTEKKNISVDEINEDIKKASKKIDSLKSERPIIQDIKVDDVVYLERYGKSAVVLAISGETLQLNMEGMRVKMNKREVVGHKVEKTVQNKVKITTKGTFSTARRELLLIGKRVEEALDLLDKFIDESLLSGYEKVFVIHGRGSGQLRKAVHEHLRSAPRVKRYALAENTDGGNAVTVVEF